MDESTRKKCIKCAEVKPLADYYTGTNGKLLGRCKSCFLERQRERRAANAERTRELARGYMRERRERDPEGVAAYQRKWRAANPDRVSAARDAWATNNYEIHRESANRANRKWKSSNPDKVREINEAWAKANPDKVAAIRRRWRNAHRLEVRERKSRRRALIREATIGEVDLPRLWILQCGICAICGTRIDGTLVWPDHMSRSIDHRVPLARGGTHEQSNLQWTHLICNIRKSDSYP